MGIMRAVSNQAYHSLREYNKQSTHAVYFNIQHERLANASRICLW